MQEILLGLGLKRPGESEESPFKGELIASPELLGTAIASQIGLTAGTVQNDDAGWLVYDFEGKTLLVAKKTLRHSISWNQINAVNAVYGDLEISFNGTNYKVRLFRGANSDPSNINNGNGPRENSEWNKLMYPLVPEPFGKPESGTSSEGITFGLWGNYTEEDLMTARDYGAGSVTLCQETTTRSTSRVGRGGNNIGVGLLIARQVSASSTTSIHGWRPVLELVRTTSEPQDLFLGEVSTDQLITGDTLATQIGLTAGTAQNSTEPWLQFLTKEGQILYIAKKPYRHSISWDQIDAVNAVYGDREITVGEKQFKVRLLKGVASDPISGGLGHDLESSWGSEWNRLFYPLVSSVSQSVQIPTYPMSGEGIVFGSWASYSEGDLGSKSGTGRGTWCQEMSSANTVQRAHRGQSGLSHLSFGNSSGTSSSFGWRPVLELIP